MLGLEVVRTDIHVAAQHAHQVDAPGERQVEQQVVSNREATQPGREFRALASGLRLLAQHLQDAPDAIEDPVGCGFVIVGNVVPDINQVEPDLGTPEDFTGHRARRVVSRELRP